MPNNAINKVVFDGRTLIDLTDTTATADKIKTGYGAYGADGVWMSGTANTGGDNGDVYQDESGYLVLSSGAGTNYQILSLNITSNGTYNASAGTAYNPVTVSVGPARSAADLTVSGSVVSGLSGYYSEAFSKAVSAGSMSVSAIAYGAQVVSTDFIMNSLTGVVSLSHDAAYTSYIGGTLTSGYVSSFIKGNLTLSIHPSYQLSTLSASTYIPTEDAQTIPRYRWLTGSQTIAAISSTYIGTGVDRKSATDMYQSGWAVYAPIGYYSSDTKYFIPTTTHLDPVIDFRSSTGIVYTNHDASDAINSKKLLAGAAVTSSSYSLQILSANIYTPGTVNQTIDRYQWLTGSQTILGDVNLISGNIKSGVSIFGVNGTLQAKIESLTVTPSKSQQVFSSTNIDGYSPVTVLGDVNLLSENIKSGVSIFGVNGTFAGGGGDLVDCNLFLSYQSSTSTQWSCYCGMGYLKDGDVIRLYGTVSGYSLDSCYTLSYSSDTVMRSASIPLGITEIPSANITFIEYLNGYLSYAYANLSGCGAYQLSMYKIIKATSDYAMHNDKYSYFNYNDDEIVRIPMDAFARNKMLLAANCYNCYEIGSSAFQLCENLNSVSFPNCFSILDNAFCQCSSLTTVNFPKVHSIGTWAFYSCRGLSNISFPEAVLIGVSAFTSCTSLTSVYFPSVTSIAASAFLGCSYITSISFPMLLNTGPSTFANCRRLFYGLSFERVTYLEAGCFYNCSSFQSIYLPKCKTIGSSTFYNCLSMNSIYFPECEIIYPYAFYSCVSLATPLDLSKCSSIGSSAFQLCSWIPSAKLLSCSFIGGNAFNRCSRLSTVILSSCTSIYTSAFWNCTVLSSLYLLGSSIPTLASVSVFYGTMLEGGTGSGHIYVPSSLYSSYLTATNWTRFSALFVSMTDAEIEALLA